jgi:Spy/CpxP family protein refolding chaperone
VLVAVGLALFGQFVVPPAALAANDSPATQSLGGRGPGPNSWEWWNDAEVQKELTLSADKIRRINDFVVRRNAELRPMVDEFFKQVGELDKMTRARVVDESTYSLQVMRVENARARLNETRTLMLYRIFKELNPEQHQKLQDILDRRYNRGGRGRPTPDAR